MRLAWLTDIHLDFVGDASIGRLCEDVVCCEVDGVLLGGDIGRADTALGFVQRLYRGIRKPLWFVLGNHDFYGGGVESVHRSATALMGAEAGLTWLGGVDVVPLTRRSALVGHDGWGDARLGDHWGSGVVLNDFFLIDELRDKDKVDLLAALRHLGDESAEHLRRVVPFALERFERVLVLTHVPPFREACWHLGRTSDDEWLPYFTCKAVGDVLLEAMTARPDRRMTVLCGHTHSAGEYSPLPNLVVLTGAAEYGAPVVQRPLLEVD